MQLLVNQSLFALLQGFLWLPIWKDYWFLLKYIFLKKTLVFAQKH